MEPATVVVLAITAACVGFCIWIERHSRGRVSAPEPSESVDVRADVAEQSGRDGNREGTHERKPHKSDPFTSEGPQARQKAKRKRQAMKLAAMFVLFIVAAVTGINHSHASPLRTIQGIVVDGKGEAVSASIVYLHDERTNAVRTHVTDPHGRFRFSGISHNTDYRIHAEHEGLMSAVRRIPAHSTSKLIKLDLKVDRKKPVATAALEVGYLSASALPRHDTIADPNWCTSL
jgi:Carboxypeptidase regulatory-like domain